MESVYPSCIQVIIAIVGEHLWLTERKRMKAICKRKKMKAIRISLRRYITGMKNFFQSLRMNAAQCLVQGAGFPAADLDTLQMVTVWCWPRINDDLTNLLPIPSLCVFCQELLVSET